MSPSSRLRGRSFRGRLAEELAVLWLRAHGASVVARRRRWAGVEVDVVARLPRLLLVVEVKSRGPGGVLAVEDLVSRAQVLRLRRAAEALGLRHGLAVRVDLVEIRWGRWPLLRWHRGPWAQ